MKKYNWEYGENKSQNYYDFKIGKDYLCVFENKLYPGVWMGFYLKNGCPITLMDKKYNDKQRKKAEKNGIGANHSSIKFLATKNPEAMKRKVVFAYETSKTEVC